MIDFFKITIYEPLYNLLVFFISVVPGGNVGVAVVLLTIVVKVILFPLYQKSLRSQMVMKEIEPKMKALQEKFKNNREELAKKTFALYKENSINPFTGILLLFIQLPILLSLYFVFANGLINHSGTLYPIVSYPEVVSNTFLGILLDQKNNIILAVLVGITQFFQARLTFPKEKPKIPTRNPASFQEEFAKSMRIQILYILPLFITVVSYYLPAVLSLYWVTSNLFSIAQEIYIRNERRAPSPQEPATNS